LGAQTIHEKHKNPNKYVKSRPWIDENQYKSDFFTTFLKNFFQNVWYFTKMM